MTLELHVTNRRIDRIDTEGNIPSGGINDVKCVVTFDFGSPWFDIPHITAIFARETKWAFQVEIEPGEPFYIPASILARQGVIYASLLGASSDGTRVAQTTTCALLVEPNGLNRNTNVIYPLDQHNEYDTDAYAQYVAAVNDAAVRAEEAARKLEDVVNPGYTKVEADARFQKKIILSENITGGVANVSDGMVGSSPAVKLWGALPRTHTTDSYTNPSDFAGVNSFVITYNTGETKTIEGFGTLYRLSTTSADYVTVIPGVGTQIHRKIQILDLKTSSHIWTDNTTLRVSLDTENKPIDGYNLNSVLTNFGKVVKTVSSNYIDITIPRNTDLTDLKIAYPLKNEYESQVTLVEFPVLAENTKTMTVKHTIGAGTAALVESFVLNLEINPFRYMLSNISAINARYTALEKRVKALEEANT